MRIVSGTLGSRRIETLSGDTTRPTSDKIRGGIFSKIGPYFSGGSFLDVFGGSGAMSFEALSRGMEHATLIEMSPKAMRVIQNNVKTLDLQTQTQLIKGDAKRVTAQMRQTFDVVFLDPPYAYEETETIMRTLIDNGCIKPDGWMIVETDSKKELFESYKTWQCIDVKDYKATKIYYYTNEL